MSGIPHSGDIERLNSRGLRQINALLLVCSSAPPSVRFGTARAKDQSPAMCDQLQKNSYALTPTSKAGLISEV